MPWAEPVPVCRPEGVCVFVAVRLRGVGHHLAAPPGAAPPRPAPHFTKLCAQNFCCRVCRASREDLPRQTQLLRLHAAAPSLEAPQTCLVWGGAWPRLSLRASRRCGAARQHTPPRLVPQAGVGVRCAVTLPAPSRLAADRLNGKFLVSFNCPWAKCRSAALHFTFDNLNKVFGRASASVRHTWRRVAGR